MGVTGIALGIGIGPFDNGGGGGGFAPQGASLTLTGGDATLLAPLIVDGASLSLSGGAVNFARDLGAAGNSLTLSGGAATLSGGSALSVITSSNGAWWVVKERDGSDNLVDQTGGGRNLTLPGGSANPVLLDHTGTDYFWFPNTTADYLSVPDSAALSITGDIDIRVAFTLDNYATGSRQGIIAKGTGLDYMLNMEPAGELRLRVVGAGNYAWNTSSAVPTPSAGNVLCIWCSLDVDNGASGNEAILRYKHVPEASAAAALDSTSGWTTMANSGTTGVVDIRDGTGVLAIGAALGNYGMLGKVYRAIIKDGIDGTTVLDVNASDADPDATTFTEASSNAATVTINRSSTGYKTAVVDQPMYVLATDDYLTSSGASAFWNLTAGQDCTLIAVCRHHAVGNVDAVIGNRAAGGQGVAIYTTTVTDSVASASDGTSYTDESTNQITGSVLQSLALRLDRTANELESVVGGVGTGTPTDITAMGACSPGNELLVGNLVSGTNYNDFEIVAAAFTKQALTDAEISDIADALITANGGTP